MIDQLSYNVWANTKLVEKLQTLDEAILYAPIKSSFPSIAKTLLHLWRAEVIWLERIKGNTLNNWPPANFGQNKKALLDGFLESSKIFKAFFSTKDPSFFNQKIEYKNLKGDSFENEIGDLIHHVVNHGTYHRGQVIALLRTLGVTKLPSTDIIFYLRNN